MLEKLQHRFFRQTEMLKDNFLYLRENSTTEKSYAMKRMKAEMLVIRLHSCWEGFCRQLLFISAVKRPMTQSSQRLRRVSKNYKAFAKAVVHLPRSNLPKWHKANFCSEVAKGMGVGNAGTIAVALGDKDSPMSEITPVRNFYVHPTPHTAEKAREKFRRKKSDPIDLDCLRLIGEFQQGGVTRYEAWVAKLREIANAAIR